MYAGGVLINQRARVGGREAESEREKEREEGGSVRHATIHEAKREDGSKRARKKKNTKFVSNTFSSASNGAFKRMPGSRYLLCFLRRILKIFVCK